jgi:DNA-binding beta-propeller fold protein YncE
VFNIDEEVVREFGTKVPPEDADASAPDGSFMWPTSIALDKDGLAYVADEWLNRISVFDKNGACINTWGITGDADGEMNHPAGLEFDSEDRLYLVDSANHRVQIFTKEGKFISSWGSEGTGDGEFSYPWGIEIDHNGDVFVADWRNDRIQKFDRDGNFLMKFGSSGNGDGELNRPSGIAVDKEGIIYVTDFKNDRLQVFYADGSYITQLTGDATLSKWGRERLELDPGMMRGRDRAQGLMEREKQFNGPIAVEVDDVGRVFIVETARQRLQVYRKQTASFHGGPL